MCLKETRKDWKILKIKEIKAGKADLSDFHTSRL